MGWSNADLKSYQSLLFYHNEICPRGLDGMAWSMITTLRGSSLAFLVGKKSQNKNFDDHIATDHNHLTSINSKIDRRYDGNVLIARELSDALPAKICWGILTP